MTETSSTTAATPLGQVDFVVEGPRYAEVHVDQLATLYHRDFIDPPLKETKFYSEESFKKRVLEDYIVDPAPNSVDGKDSSFKIVTAWRGEQLVGFVYGASLPPGTGWWKDATEPLPEQLISEDGRRTFGLFDLVVRREFRGHKIARQLHSQLLEERSEERVTLICAESRIPAYSIWLHWGYRTVATIISPGNNTAREILIRQLGRP